MGRGKTDGKQLKTTLSGYALWAVEKLRDDTQKTDSAALAAVVERWLAVDKEYLGSFGISVETFKRTRGENIKRFEKKPG